MQMVQKDTISKNAKLKRHPYTQLSMEQKQIENTKFPRDCVAFSLLISGVQKSCKTTGISLLYFYHGLIINVIYSLITLKYRLFVKKIMKD